MNTLARHDQQVEAVLNLLKKAKFTSASNMQMAAGRERRGLPTQLMNEGLVLKRQLTASQAIYGLSKLGADTIGANYFDLSKVSLSRAAHSLVGQYETLNAMKAFDIVDFDFEKKHLGDIPDAIWHLAGGLIRLLEVELSGKSVSDGEFDRFILKLIRAAMAGIRTVVVFVDPAMQNRYLEHFRRCAKQGIPGWDMTDGKWEKNGYIEQVPPELWSMITFRLHKKSWATVQHHDDTLILRRMMVPSK